MSTTPISWPEAQIICDIPEVRAALDAFAADAHDENMLAMVSAIMGHAFAQGRAAGLEEAAKECDEEYRIRVNAAEQHTRDSVENKQSHSGARAASNCARAIRALSAAPAGGLGEVVVPRNWEEAIGEARKAIDSDEPSGWGRSGYRDYANVVLDGLADRLGALAAAQGEGK